MKQAVSCPKCQKIYQISPELLGKRLQCGQCGSAFLVTPTATAQHPAAPQSQLSIAASTTRPAASPAALPTGKPVAQPAAPVGAVRQAIAKPVGSKPASVPPGTVPTGTVPTGKVAPATARPAMAGAPVTAVARPVGNQSSSGQLAPSGPRAAAPAPPLDLDPLSALLDAELSQPSAAANPLLSAPKPARRKGLHIGVKFAVAGSIALVVLGVGIKIAISVAALAMDDLKERARTASAPTANSPRLTSSPANRPLQVQTQSGDLSWPAGDYQRKVNDVIGMLQQSADLLAAIHDRATAESNVPQVEKLGNQITTLAADIDRMEHSGNFTLDEAQFAQQRLPQINSVVARIQSEVQRLQALGQQLQMQERFSRVGRVGFGQHAQGPSFNDQPRFGGPPTNIPPPPQLAPIPSHPHQPQPIQPVVPRVRRHQGPHMVPQH